ncbi:MAG: hypothetical protein FWE40_08380 [Oscillospiraceae bacterium]|nr:hypothetical protein [Oscillospiraceae bacterium]
MKSSLKILIVLLAMVVINLNLLACSQLIIPEDEQTPTLLVGITLDVKQQTVCSVRASFVLYNGSDTTVLFSEAFTLEVWQNATWQPMEPILNQRAFIPYRFDKIDIGETQLFTQEWAWRYSELEPGRYRFVKTFFNAASIFFHDFAEATLYAEFEVLENQQPDYPFMNAVDTSPTSLHVLEYWNPNLTGKTRSGEVPLLATATVDMATGWVMRSGVIGEDDIGDFMISFADFTNDMTHVNAAVYIGERRAAYRHGLIDSDSLTFEILSGEQNKALQVVMNTHLAPYGGTVVIEIKTITP